jgi:type I restriction enzyme S subunit
MHESAYTFPADWDTRTIGDIACHVGSGITPTGGSSVYSKTGITFIRSQNVTFKGLQLNDVAFIEPKIHQQMARSEIFPHDVLLNITGASIGRCCFVPDGFGIANVNQHVCAIRLPQPSHEDAVFLSGLTFPLVIRSTHPSGLAAERP